MKPIVHAARLTVLGCVAVLATVVAVHSLKLSLYRIQTGSMAPDFPVGTLVLDSGVVPPEPHQAITFMADHHPVTHVLTGYGQDGSLITRGLANPTADHWSAPVYKRDIRGRVLVRILLLAPSFWMSARGIACGAALSFIGVSLYLWKRTMTYPRLQSSSK
jgi:hypothetical protein